MKARKILSMILVLTMIFSTMSIAVLAGESENTEVVTSADLSAGESEATETTCTCSTDTTWDGTSICEHWFYNAPQGTTVFEIDTAAELAGFASLVNVPRKDTKLNGSHTVKLTADIDLNNNEWTPIGNIESYLGSFDGGNHIISNLKITQHTGNATKCAGFFAYVTNYTSEIKNFTIHNAIVTVPTKERVAVVIGNAPKATVKNVKVTGNVEVKGLHYTGAIVGHGYSIIEDCSVEANGVIESVDFTAGGIIGILGAASSDHTPSLKNCSVIGKDGSLEIKAANGIVAAVCGNNVGTDTPMENLYAENVAVSIENGSSSSNFVVGRNSAKDSAFKDVTLTVSGENVDVTTSGAEAQINGVYYSSIELAIAAAEDGDIVTIQPGIYSAFNPGDKNITIQGTLDEEGNHLTVIKGGMTAHGFSGTLKDFWIDNAFTAIYAEPAGDISFDNVRITNSTYGMHLIAYQSGRTWTIENCYMDISWANSLSAHECEQPTIIFRNNKFVSTSPYYSNYGAPVINTYAPNTIIEDNVFGENAKIYVRTEEAAEGITIGANYYEDGASNAFVDDYDNYTANIYPVYIDESMTTVSNVELVNYATVGNINVTAVDLNKLVSDEDLTNNVKYSLKAEYITPDVALDTSVTEGKNVEYIDISPLRNGEEIGLDGKKIYLDFEIGAADEIEVYHFNGSSWDKLTKQTIGFVTDSMSPFAVVYTAAPVNTTDIATEINVSLKKVNDSKYDIVLTGADEKTINRFMSAEFTFDLVSDTLSYEIVKNGHVNIVYPTDDSETYEFNLNGTDKSDLTGNEITVATVEFSGYGAGTFSIVGSDNIVHTAEIDDNIVDTFNAANNNLILSDATDVAINIPVPTQVLTVEVDFPNAIVDNCTKYQDMTLTISGGDLAKNIEYDLGTDGEALNAGKYTVDTVLTQNTTYTVTVKGAGYRTVRKNVTMTENKTVNFWNNVKDVEGADYLAGDIVKDNTINVYDLSAVVSYFGKNNDVDEESTYAKYDLNRDGKVDSKDVAYVLVSWGK